MEPRMNDDPRTRAAHLDLRDRFFDLARWEDTDVVVRQQEREVRVAAVQCDHDVLTVNGHVLDRCHQRARGRGRVGAAVEVERGYHIFRR